MHAGQANEKSDEKVKKLIPIVGDDPMPYGLEANLQSIEALRTYAFQQGLMPTRLPIEDLFYPFERLAVEPQQVVLGREPRRLMGGLDFRLPCGRCQL